MRRAYNKKSNVIYGVFDDNVDSYPFQTMVRALLDGGEDFYSFSCRAMSHYMAVIDEVGAATGGYVVFGRYNDQAEDYLLCTMLNDTAGYAFDNDLNLKENFHLELNKLQVASRLNITKWEGESADNHLSFASGTKDVSQYFKRFVGCTSNTPSKLASERFKRALTDFLNSEFDDPEERDSVRVRVFEHCREKVSKRSPIHLDTVSHLIDDERPEAFSEFAAGQEYGVDSQFSGHGAVIRGIGHFRYKSSRLTIDFEQGLLGDQVHYDDAEGTLTITDVPEILRDQIRSVAT